jgi:hypothetical protein
MPYVYGPFFKRTDVLTITRNMFWNKLVVRKERHVVILWLTLFYLLTTKPFGVFMVELMLPAHREAPLPLPSPIPHSL